MDDKKQIEALYEKMYKAMIEKDERALKQTLADDFFLAHMTGMRQNKDEYIKSIMNGVLNYFSAKTGDVEINVFGDEARMTGKSVVSAAVFGGGRNTWRLRLEKTNGEWQFTGAKASTFYKEDNIVYEGFTHQRQSE